MLHLNGWLTKYDKRQSVALLRRAADGGDPDAMAQLGDLYEAGNIVGRDVKRAADWHAKAATAKDALSALQLAWIMDQGLGMEQNSESAAAHIVWHLQWTERPLQVL